MTSRQKAGLSLFITGVVGVITGVFALATQDTPQWVSIGITTVGVVLKALGFVVNFPSETNPK